GHTAALLKRLSERRELQKHKILAVDRDPSAVVAARTRFAREISEGRLQVIQSRMSELVDWVAEHPVMGLMADLGFSSDQIESGERGLSFMKEGPLDMRLNPEEGQSCREFLAVVRELDLVKILREYGEERFAGRIAGAIIKSRREKNLPKTTSELAHLITRAVPPAARHGRIHAATRTFQALRIAVNDELEELDSLLERVILRVKIGGCIAILSFHSLEDRKVKFGFRVNGLEPTTKKPIEPSEEEVRINPRARSAKLRLAIRVEENT
ncbi:MAG: 16S rRNA (cytosine(1402)-N(4))-methyltransferase RsmH, partial [Bdellovibrionota bacterium]